MNTTHRIQRVTNPDNWLYLDMSENDRVFRKEARLTASQPDLPECTNEEKEEWERQHPQPEPEV